MKNDIIKIGIMGGAFNPVHMGHLFLAEQARVCFNLHSVIFLPSGIPGYPKEEQPIAAKHRIEMTLLAINDHPHFLLSSHETDQAEPTFTIQTLRAFREKYPKEAYELYFITGADAVLDILKWKEPRALLELAQFIAGSRPHHSLEDFGTFMVHYPWAKARVHFMQIPLLEISSRLIREYVRQGKSVRYLVPRAVEQYIEKQQLYAIERGFC